MKQKKSSKPDRFTYKIITVSYLIPLGYGLLIFWIGNGILNQSNWQILYFLQIFFFFLFLFGGILLGSWQVLNKKSKLHHAPIKKKVTYALSQFLLIGTAYFSLQPAGALKDMMLGEQRYTGSCQVDTKYQRKQGVVCYIVFNNLDQFTVEANNNLCRQISPPNTFNDFGFYDGDCTSLIQSIFLKNTKKSLLLTPVK